MAFEDRRPTVDPSTGRGYACGVRQHHTKNKGDVGVLRAQADLAEKGFGVLLPLTEHEAFDLVAYKGGTFRRIQVKYRSAVDGAVEIRFRTSWADRNGTHTSPMNKGDVDLVCVYCPETSRCYYLDPRRFRGGVKLRVEPARNNQSKGVYPADDFLEIPWPLSSARIEQGPSKAKVAGSNPAGATRASRRRFR
jgi:hypothetical protein